MYLELVLLVLLICFLYVFLSKPTEMPPGTFGLPLLGNLPPKDRSMTQHLRDMRDKYGPIFTTKWGSFPVVILTEFETIKKVFSSSDVTARPNIHSVKALNLFHPGGVIMSEGLIWNNNRRFMLRNLRDLGMGKTVLESSIQSEAEKLVTYIEAMDLSQPVDLTWVLNVCVLNVIWQMSAGIRYEPDDETVKLIAQHVDEDIQIIQGPMFLFDILPWLKKLVPQRIFDKITASDELLGHRKTFSEIAMKIIRQHEETLDPANPRDLVDSFLIDAARDSSSNVNYDNLVTIMKDSIFGGMETTAATLRWFILYMALYQDKQKKLQEVLDENIPRDRQPSWQDKRNLQYLDAVMMETLRFSSFMKIGLYRCSFKDIQVEGYTVPKDTMFFGALEMVHKDSALWEKPEEFYPEHFLTPDGQLKGKSQGFLPFSLGRRSCIGEPLALMELFLFGASLLQKFNVLPPEGDPLCPSTDETKYMVNHSRPYKVLMRPRT